MNPATFDHRDYWERPPRLPQGYRTTRQKQKPVPTLVGSHDGYNIVRSGSKDQSWSIKNLAMKVA